MIVYNDSSSVNKTEMIDRTPKDLRLIFNGYDAMYLVDLLSNDELKWICSLPDESFVFTDGEYVKTSLFERLKSVIGKGRPSVFVGKMTYKEFCAYIWNCRNDFAQILGYVDYDDMKNHRTPMNGVA